MWMEVCGPYCEADETWAVGSRGASGWVELNCEERSEMHAAGGCTGRGRGGKVQEGVGVCTGGMQRGDVRGGNQYRQASMAGHPGSISPPSRRSTHPYPHCTIPPP